MLAGGPETLRLQQMLRCDIGSQVSMRRATGCGEGFIGALNEVGGLALTPHRWAGLDRTPPAGAEWLSILGDELEHLGAEAGSLPSECGDDLGCYDPRTRMLHHQRWVKPSAEGSAQLWRCRHERGYWVYLWTGGTAPSESPYLRLSRDAALRTMFALDRNAGYSIELEANDEQEWVAIDVGCMLPKAEYRFLMTFADRCGGEGFRYRVLVGLWPQVSSILTSRLGVVISKKDSK